MNTILFILGGITILVGVIYYFMKSGKIADKDGNLIPDVVEDAVEDVKKTAKEVKARAKNVAKEAKDVVDAVKGTPKKRKKPASKKVTKAHLRSLSIEELREKAKAELSVNFEESTAKTNIINKMYELYNKK